MHGFLFLFLFLLLFYCSIKSRESQRLFVILALLHSALCTLHSALCASASRGKALSGDFFNQLQNFELDFIARLVGFGYDFILLGRKAGFDKFFLVFFDRA